MEGLMRLGYMVYLGVYYPYLPLPAFTCLYLPLPALPLPAFTCLYLPYTEVRFRSVLGCKQGYNTQVHLDFSKLF